MGLVSNIVESYKKLKVNEDSDKFKKYANLDFSHVKYNVIKRRDMPYNTTWVTVEITGFPDKSLENLKLYDEQSSLRSVLEKQPYFKNCIIQVIDDKDADKNKLNITYESKADEQTRFNRIHNRF